MFSNHFPRVRESKIEYIHLSSEAIFKCYQIQLHKRFLHIVMTTNICIAVK